MRIIENAVAFIGVTFLAWLTISWVQVIALNLGSNPTYSAWNLLSLLFS